MELIGPQGPLQWWQDPQKGWTWDPELSVNSQGLFNDVPCGDAGDPHFTLCEVRCNPCENNPCWNGGTCQEVEDTGLTDSDKNLGIHSAQIKCECPEGTKGKACELGKPKDPQQEDPVEAAEVKAPKNACSQSAIDLLFIVDGSGSVGSENFKKALDFVDDISQSLDIDGGARVGMIQYSVSAKLEFDFLSEKTKISKALSKVIYEDGIGTKTGAALQFAMSRFH